MLTSKSVENSKKEGGTNRSTYVFLAILVVSYFAFALQHLTKFLTADEHYWIYERIPQYWDALFLGELKKTYINDKPGVSIALVSGFGYFANYQEMRDGVEQNKYIKSLDPHSDDNLQDNFLALRLPLVIFNGLFLIVFFWLIKKITENDWIALWGVLFAALSPILIGISQIINPDALLWSFSTGAILSYLNLLKSSERKFLALTAVFVGMAILTKYVSNILFPLLAFLLIYYFLIEYGQKIKVENAKEYVLRQLAYYGIVVAGALVTVSVFMPAVFVKISYLKKLTLDFSGLQKTSWLIILAIIFLLADMFWKNRLTFFFQKFILRKDVVVKFVYLMLIFIFAGLLLGRYFNPEWSLFQNVSFDTKNLSDIKDLNQYNFIHLALLEFSPLVFSLTPIVVLLVLTLWIKRLFGKGEQEFLTFSLSVFLLLYYFGSIFSDTLATIRYSIILYPLLAILAGISLWEISLYFKQKYEIKIMFTVAVFACSFVSLYLIKPFYFNYTSALLPKNQTITDSWGYGGYEAVQYLNAMPGSENMMIWSDFFGVCEFFQGKCLTAYNVNSETTKIDYYVLTRRGKIRYKGNRDGAGAKKYYEAANPVWELYIDDRPDNYIKIYKSIN
jgi:hypothetical protein